MQIGDLVQGHAHSAIGIEAANAGANNGAAGSCGVAADHVHGT